MVPGRRAFSFFFLPIGMTCTVCKMSSPVLSLYFTLYETYENKKNITEFFTLSKRFRKFLSKPLPNNTKKATMIEKKTLNTNN